MVVESAVDDSSVDDADVARVGASGDVVVRIDATCAGALDVDPLRRWLDQAGTSLKPRDLNPGDCFAASFSRFFDKPENEYFLPYLSIDFTAASSDGETVEVT